MSARTFYERPVELNGHKFIRLKSGRLLTFLAALDEAKDAHTTFVRNFSRAFKLAMDEYDLQRLEYEIDNLETYLGALRQHLEEQRGTQTTKERITLLRNIKGRTPEEAALFLKKADDLERELGE